LDDELAVKLGSWGMALKIVQWVLGVAAILVMIALAVVYALQPPNLTPPAISDHIISGVTVVNPGVGRAANQTIIIEDGRIAEIRPVAPGDPPPVCAGCYAMPGLIDAHVHTPPRLAAGNQELFALLYLVHGVTSVRDVGQSEESVRTLALNLNSGKLVGPRMFRCGPVLDGDPPGWPSSVKVTTDAQGRAAVDAIAASGATCVKVYNEITMSAYAGIRDAAKAHGLSLIGHVPHRVTLRNVEDFESQHLTGVAYLNRPRPPTNWDLRMSDLLAMSEAEIDAAMVVAKTNRVSFTPTMINIRNRLIQSDPKRFPPTPGTDSVPRFWRFAWPMIANAPKDEAVIQDQIQATPWFHRFVKRARDGGIDILAGTDTLMPFVVPGEALFLEVRELALAFGDNDAALAAATLVNGRHLAKGDIGELKPGALADLLLLPADPAQNLTATQDWRILYVNGRRYNRVQVDAWNAAYQKHFQGWLYDAVMTNIIAPIGGQHGNATAKK
jgi:hypothetical protein